MTALLAVIAVFGPGAATVLALSVVGSIAYNLSLNGYDVEAMAVAAMRAVIACIFAVPLTYIISRLIVFPIAAGAWNEVTAALLAIPLLFYAAVAAVDFDDGMEVTATRAAVVGAFVIIGCYIVWPIAAALS